MSIEIAATEFVRKTGIRFSFRWLGPRRGRPLVCLQHFSGTMDSWDPAVVNELSRHRPVIVFNNTGVGETSGKTPDNVDQMAEDAAAFISTLCAPSVDLLGFSLGGMVAQVLASEYPGGIGKVILAGTAPQGGEEHLMEALQDAIAQKDAPDLRLPLFFTSSEASRAAGLDFLKRTSVRTAGRDPDSGEEIMRQQAKALIGWCASKDPTNSVLKAIQQPVLLVSGSHDTMLPNVNAIEMFRHLANAQLILYPDAGQGAIFQYPSRFVQHALHFLSE